MKEIKRRMELVSFYDRSAIEQRLEAMSQQGWMIEQPGSYLWRYRRMEPTKLRFAVTYFPAASDFDPGPTDAQRQMEEYCARDGWIPAVRWGQMQIFYNERENPTPIETDAVTQVETIHRTMRKNMWAHYVLLALCIYQLGFCILQMFSDPVDFLATPSSLNMMLMWLLLPVAPLRELFCYFSWRRRARAAAEQGEFLEIKTKRGESVILLGISILVTAAVFASIPARPWFFPLWLGVTLFIILMVQLAKRHMKRKGISRNVNRTVSVALSVSLAFVLLAGLTFSIVRHGLWDTREPVGTYEKYGLDRRVYADEIPLRIEDLITPLPVDWSTERQTDETFLLSRTEYIQWPLSEERGIPDLEYTVTEVKAPFLYEFCKRGLTHPEDEVRNGQVVLEDHYEPSDPAPWSAQEAYRLYFSSGYLNRYLLCYENCFVELRFDWEPTVQQMAVVAETLGK